MMRPSGHDAARDTPPDLGAFRTKVRDYRKPTGHAQNALAATLGVHPAILSNKLNGTKDAYLTTPEIKAIILTLARWEAITRQSEAVELLALVALRRSSFSEPEWRTAPLGDLVADGHLDNAGPALNLLPRVAPTLHNLPAEATPLVGRAAECAMVGALVQDPAIRRVTLTGPGGIGKSRVALRVAEDLCDAFADGVWWVDLAAVTDPAMVPQTIARTLAVQEDLSPAHTPVDTLAAYFRPRHLLLVLDNFEQVAAAAAVIQRMLVAAPHVTVLTTSRVVLRLAGEHEHSVPPLLLPNAHTPEQGTATEAMLLFAQQARQVQPNFTLSAENWATIAAICVRLEGVPLAIELAAARLTVLTAQSLLTRLDEVGGNLRVLTRGEGNATARHHTVRSTIAWSYAALSSAEQRLFQRLAVFDGGWSLEAAEAIMAEGASPAHMVPPLSVLDGLSGLLDHSLIHRVGRGEGEERFIFLETIKEYAREKLGESGEEAQLRTRHATYILEFAWQFEREQDGPDLRAWFQRLETDLANVRAALHWFGQDRESGDRALQLCVALRRFWLMHGLLREGRQWFETTLAATPTASDALRARALTAVSALASMQGDYAEAKAFAETGLVLCRAINDQTGSGAALMTLGNIAKEQGDPAQADSHYATCLAINRALENKPGMAIALNNLGNTALERGDYARARALYEESLTLKREAGFSGGIARTLVNVGFVTVLQGDYDRAVTLYHEALSRMEEVGDADGIMLVYYNLGDVALYQHAYTRAAEMLTKSMQLSWDLNKRATLPRCLEGLAVVALAHTHADRAARLLGQATALRQVVAVPLPASEQARYDVTYAATRRQLGAARFTALWQEGGALPLEQTVHKSGME